MIKMKNLIAAPVVILALLLAGCTAMGNLKIDETATNQAIAYGAGKGMGFAILKLVPDADQDLQTAFDGMMERNKAVKIVSGAEVVAFFSESVLILTRYTKNPYGLISDLSVVLMIYGARYDAAGNMVSINPVPKSVIMFFGLGYDSGRAIVIKDDLAAMLYGKPWLAWKGD
jgi:hypothetical protein